VGVRARVVGALSWPVRQVRGWGENVRDVLTETDTGDVLPPAIVETGAWLREQVPRAAGTGTPGEQMAASVVLAFASVLTSLFTGGVTLFFVALFLLTFLVGAFRLVPAVDALWPLGESET